MARWRDVKHKKPEENQKPSQEVDNSICNASLINRFKAFVTDMFMLLMPILYLVFYVVMGSREDFQEDMLNGWMYIVIPNMVIVIAFWFYKQQTPGMKAYEIAIVDSKTGEKPMIIWLINRYLLTFFVIFMPILWLIPFFNKKRKTLQDFLSGTCVTSKPNEQLN
jgi:uncharacterized RDD family membrane protein YckC